MLHDELLKPGARLDRYELLAPRARGGMGMVWLARLVGKYGFERLFALKTIRAEYAREPEFRAMFLDEARVASRIQDEHVVQVVELGEHEELLYLVMDWVEGESLTHFTQMARTTTLPTGVVLRAIIDATKGLQAAHEARDDKGHLLDVVHRDVSPHNLLVSTRGATKVIDFGIAKARDRIAADSSHGQVKGKISYLAPEQILGTRLGPHTDVFSLGCVLYELLSGKTPYGGGTDAEIIARHLKRARIEPPSVDPLLRDIISCALAREPADRFPSMAHFRESLEKAVRARNFDATQEAVSAFATDAFVEHRRERESFVNVALSWAKLREESGSRITIGSPLPSTDTQVTSVMLETGVRLGESVVPKTRSKTGLWVLACAVAASAVSLVGTGLGRSTTASGSDIEPNAVAAHAPVVRIDAPSAFAKPAEQVSPSASVESSASAPGTGGPSALMPNASAALHAFSAPSAIASPPHPTSSSARPSPTARGHAGAGTYAPPSTPD